MFLNNMHKLYSKKKFIIIIFKKTPNEVKMSSDTDKKTLLFFPGAALPQLQHFLMSLDLLCFQISLI